MPNGAQVNWIKLSTKSFYTIDILRTIILFRTNIFYYIEIIGYPNETKENELKEEPRAINFTITNRRQSQSKDVGRKNKGIDLNNESTSASRLIPGHDPYYTDNSKSKILIYPGCICISVVFSFIWKRVSLSCNFM